MSWPLRKWINNFGFIIFLFESQFVNSKWIISLKMKNNYNIQKTACASGWSWRRGASLVWSASREKPPTARCFSSIHIFHCRQVINDLTDHSWFNFKWNINVRVRLRSAAALWHVQPPVRVARISHRPSVTPTLQINRSWSNFNHFEIRKLK